MKILYAAVLFVSKEEKRFPQQRFIKRAQIAGERQDYFYKDMNHSRKLMKYINQE